jgi:triosephosphate isomerase
MNKLMAANWKMHKTRSEAKTTASDLVDIVGEPPTGREVLIIPVFTALESVGSVFSGRSGYALGAQNFYPENEGAFTGEISPGMLLDLGCEYALAGHSERRHVMGEDDEFVGRKVAFGLDKGLKMILCIGETLDQRKAGQVGEVIKRHLGKGLEKVDPSKASPETVVVAYEPVWAIGTGETAGPEEISEAHGIVREELEASFPGNASQVRILYGGSVKPDNAAEIISLDNVDGVLVGGASLQADSFSKIVTA